MKSNTFFSEKLITPEKALSKGQEIARTLEILYGGPAVIRMLKIPVENLFPTEPFFERTKLGLVLRAILVESYHAPIVVLKESSWYFLIDGHHRAYVYWLTGREYVNAVIIRVTTLTYNTRRKTWKFWEMQLFNDKLPENPLERLWRFVAGVVHFYTREYKGIFRLRLGNVTLDSLVPTQPYVEFDRIIGVKRNRLIEEPILCLEKDGRKYILDGHARSLILFEQGAARIKALIIYPIKNISRLGIEKVVEKMGLQTLADVSIL